MDERQGGRVGDSAWCPEPEIHFLFDSWSLRNLTGALIDVTWPLVLAQVYSEVHVPTQHFPMFLYSR